jgi:hypothetical protein
MTKNPKPKIKTVIARGFRVIARLPGVKSPGALLKLPNSCPARIPQTENRGTMLPGKIRAFCLQQRYIPNFITPLQPTSINLHGQVV